ncbi:suppressor of fused domain protein [Hymenobacter sediminis]|uniref:suppressor of fused domain protein n=1 Tax=Hymenobacter sediminis TaxID=2218621 RepID=UPI000DA668F2|nr:suppressor of fused domain protein [Hymenobacter sediminis]RPD49621.1 suppressor of fused domain protein [Hymenobacter sediminis]
MYNLAQLQAHLEQHWQVQAERLSWSVGPTEKLDVAFRVLEFAPGAVHAMWIYSTLGMSLNRPNNAIEIHIFSNEQNRGLVELLAVIASYHRNDLPLGIHHTVNFGMPWQKASHCSFGYISLPYLDGEALEIFNFQKSQLHNLWLIPITKKERDYKIANGWDALEEAFEKGQLSYTSPQRRSCV